LTAKFRPIATAGLAPQHFVRPELKHAWRRAAIGYAHAVTYRLNLYRGSKLTSTELVDASLDEARELAVAAIGRQHAHRAELVNKTGTVIFQRWAVL
jgi:hypothetical protein